jgi:hypothetical protein
VLGSHVVHSKSFFFSNFSYFRMTRTMARIQALAVRRLGLPPWMYVYPATRISYALLPRRAKRLLRRRPDQGFLLAWSIPTGLFI